MKSPSTCFNKTCRALVLLCLAAAAGSAACADSGRAGIESVIVRPSVASTRAAQSVLLGVAHAGSRLVAVGERGIILLSDDNAGTWRQVETPTSVTLTAVRFSSAQVGWAVGHYGVVLKTVDGGGTWSRQFDGVAAAAAAQQAALARLSASPDDERAKKGVAEAARLVSDGPDKPFLDLYFFDDLHGFIVGAYNLIFETRDGGQHWLPRLDALDNPRGNHLYAMVGRGDTLFIVGEQGVVFRSEDAGRNFTRLTTPYSGSYFCAAWLHAEGRADTVVIAGLRGNAWRSSDDGGSWQRVDGLPPVSLLAATTDSQGRLWLANQAGQIFSSSDGGLTLSHPDLPAGLPSLPLTQITNTSQGLVATTLRGVFRLSTPPRP